MVRDTWIHTNNCILGLRQYTSPVKLPSKAKKGKIPNEENYTIPLEILKTENVQHISFLRMENSMITRFQGACYTLQFSLGACM